MVARGHGALSWPAMSTNPAPHLELRTRLEGVLSRLTPTWLRSELDDLVQAAHLKILGRSGAEALPQSFLYRVGHSVLVDEIRRRKRKPVQSLGNVEPLAADESPEVLVAGHEIGAAIRRSLKELRPDQRRCVALYLQGHSVPEIARLLSFDPKKAENNVYRGLATLRERLRAQGLEP